MRTCSSLARWFSSRGAAGDRPRDGIGICCCWCRTEPAGSGRMLAGALALTIAAVFTGAAIYVKIADQPARPQLDNRSLRAEGSRPTSGLHDAGAPRHRWRALRAPSLTQHPRLAWAARSHRPARIAPTDRRLMDTPPEAATAGNRMLERWAFPCRTKRSELRSSPDPSVGSALKVRGTTALPPTYASGSWTGGTAAATRSVSLICRAQD